MQTDPSEWALGDWLGPGLELGVLLIGGAALIGLLVMVAKLASLIPMERQRRELVERVQPVLGVLLVLPYLFFALHIALRRNGQVQTLALVILCGALFVAGWFAVRDLIAGVVLKASRVCTIGDQIRVGDFEGRVGKMGTRALTLETSQGQEAVVPYSTLSRTTILRTPAIHGGALHVFRLKTPPEISVSDTRQKVLEGALCAHWASVVRAPEIKPLGNHIYEVTVFPLNSDYGLDVESAILRSTGFTRPPE